MKIGSLSFTIGKCRRFPRYTKWLMMLRAHRRRGKRSTRRRRRCRAMMA